jgi:hypothetical protein
MNKKTASRIKSLLPNGLPRYVRCYDNGGKTFDRFTVVFSGNYRSIPNRRCRAKNGPLDFQNVGMSESPFHPQGFGQNGESERQIDVNKSGFAPAMGRKNHLGKRIPFVELPADCQTLVLNDYRTIWGLPSPLESLTAKLNPSRFTAMSPKMASIVAHILGQEWVNPQVNSLMVTSDGFVLAQVKGDVGYNHFIGAEDDLQTNWRNLLDCATLGDEERATAEKLYGEKVRHC